MKKTLAAVLAVATLAVAMPQSAEAQYRRHYYHRGNAGAAIAGGLAAGLIGGALIAGATRPAYGAPVVVDPGYAPYYAAPRRVYVEPEYEAPVVCRRVRQPLYDEYGRVAAYRAVRVCN